MYSKMSRTWLKRHQNYPARRYPLPPKPPADMIAHYAYSTENYLTSVKSLFQALLYCLNEFFPYMNLKQKNTDTERHVHANFLKVAIF